MKASCAMLLQWASAGALNHTYAAKEFERQVFGRLQSDPEAQRVMMFSVRANLDREKSDYLSSFPRAQGLRWNDKEVGSAKNIANPAKANLDQEKGADVSITVEGDLYLKKEGLQLSELFKDCADAYNVICAPDGTCAEDVWKIATTAELPIMMCEVAETPQSLRGKLWQLERAITYGPDEFKTGTRAAVVCLNGDRCTFDTAVAAAKGYFSSEAAQRFAPGLTAIPVIAIWTQYRNVYAEIRTMKRDLDTVKSDLDTVKSDLDTVKATMATMVTKRDLAEMNGGLEAMLGNILSKLTCATQG